MPACQLPFPPFREKAWNTRSGPIVLLIEILVHLSRYTTYILNSTKFIHKVVLIVYVYLINRQYLFMVQKIQE